MYCSNCGKEIDNSTMFCPYCGAKTGASNVEKTKSENAPSRINVAFAVIVCALTLMSIVLKYMADHVTIWTLVTVGYKYGLYAGYINSILLIVIAVIACSNIEKTKALFIIIIINDLIECFRCLINYRDQFIIDNNVWKTQFFPNSLIPYALSVILILLLLLAVGSHSVMRRTFSTIAAIVYCIFAGFYVYKNVKAVQLFGFELDSKYWFYLITELAFALLALAIAMISTNKKETSNPRRKQW